MNNRVIYKMIYYILFTYKIPIIDLVSINTNENYIHIVNY